MVGDAARAAGFSRKLFDAGVLAPSIGYPTVPQGKARLRAMISATHKRAELETALEIIGRVGKEMGII